jgi:hypothetical protein
MSTQAITKPAQAANEMRRFRIEYEFEGQTFEFHLELPNSDSVSSLHKKLYWARANDVDVIIGLPIHIATL